MPIRKNRFPRRPVFIMDSSDEDDDDIAHLSSAAQSTPFHKQDEIPIDLSVKPSGLIGDKTQFLNGTESRNNMYHNGTVSMDDDNGANGDDEDEEEEEDGERSDSGPPPLGEPYVSISSPLELKFLRNQQDLEDEEEPQDLSTRSRGPPPLYGSSPSASPPSSSSSLLSVSSHDSSLTNHRIGYGPSGINGLQISTRYASDPHLRHHKRERLEEMVNHLRKRTNTSGLTLAIDDQLSPQHPSLVHHTLEHDAVKRSNSCSSLRQNSYLNHRNRHDIPPSSNNSSQHERLLACLAKPPLKDPMHGLDPSSETEGMWRPEDIFLLPTNGDQNYIASNEDLANNHSKHAFAHPHYAQNSFLHRVMSSSLSLMASMPSGDSFLRHFQNAPPSYLPLMAYNYYAQLMQLGQYAAANGNGNSHPSPPFPAGKVPRSPRSPKSSPVSPSASAGSDKPSIPMTSPRLNDNINGKTADSILSSPPLLSPNANNMTDIPRKRAPRALTGKHVKHGTGASPSTLLTLRQKIEQRQRIRQVVGDFRPPVKGRGPPPKRKQPAPS